MAPKKTEDVLLFGIYQSDGDFRLHWRASPKVRKLVLRWVRLGVALLLVLLGDRSLSLVRGAMDLAGVLR